MSNDYTGGPDDGPIGVSNKGKNPNKSRPATDQTGNNFANAVKNNPLIQVAGGIADAPATVARVSDKVGKKIGKFGRALGIH